MVNKERMRIGFHVVRVARATKIVFTCLEIGTVSPGKCSNSFLNCNKEEWLSTPYDKLHS